MSEPKLAGSQPEGGRSLAERRGCMVCHKIDTKVVGPAYVEVANKYRGDNEAASKLVEKVMKGGSGVWGQIPMPPQAQLSPEDARQLVAWVLALPGE
ncbi:MAG: c-type cytochrome [Planctomycetota bacterium]